MNYSNNCKSFSCWEEKEKNYNYSNKDKTILSEFCSEINFSCNEDIHYLAELDEYYYPGAAEIIVKYLNLFETEEIKSYLIRQIAFSKMDNASIVILELYNHCKTTKEYLKNDYDTIFTIGCNYDWCFKKIKPKDIKRELLGLVSNPRDAFNLSSTVKMISSWNMLEMEYILKTYLLGGEFDNSEFCVYEKNADSIDLAEFMKSTLIYLGLYGLRYYPSEENLEIVKSYLNWKHCFRGDVAKISYIKIKKSLSKR